MEQGRKLQVCHRVTLFQHACVTVNYQYVSPWKIVSGLTYFRPVRFTTEEECQTLCQGVRVSD